MDEILLTAIAGPLAMLMLGGIGYFRLRAEGRRLDERESRDAKAGTEAAAPFHRT